MGCWNETCMLSRTPVFSGDRIYAGLVAMRPAWDTVYPDCVFMPVAPLVEAGYDDYGCPESVKAPDAVLDIYQSLRVETEHDGAYDAVELDYKKYSPDEMMQALFDAARHERAFLVDTHPGQYQDQKLPLFPVIILGRFWDLAQKSVKQSDLWGERPVKNDVTLRTRLPGQFAAFLREGKLDEKDTMIPHLKLQTFMMRCRASWQPTCGSGSQDGLNPEMVKLAKEVVKYRNELRDEWG